MNTNLAFHFFNNSRIVLLAILLMVLCFNSIAQDSIDSTNIITLDPIEQELPSLGDNFSNEVPIRILTKGDAYVDGWFFLVNIMLLVLLLFKFLLFGDYSKKSWNAWVNQNLFFQLIREKQPLNAVLFIIEFLFKVYIIALIALLSLFLLTGHWELEFKDFGYIYISLFAFFSVKLLIGLILSFLTEKWGEFKILTLMNVVFTSNMSWFLIPIIWLIVYLDYNLRKYLVFILLGIGVIALIVYIFRGVNVLRKIRMPLNVHFFIYLCAFEIVPYLILLKVLYNFKLVS